MQDYLAVAYPYKVPGTSWGLNPRGDHDFREILLSYMLTFPPLARNLDHATKTRIAKVLILEEGYKPHFKTPNSLGILGETENHKLMRETSRHLKNQWLMANDSTAEIDRKQWRKHAEVLFELAHEAVRTGGYEYNSRPYFGYTIVALLVMHDCTELPELKTAAAQALDQLMRGMAWAVYDRRFSGPFRRQIGRAYDTDLSKHAGIGLLVLWASRENHTQLQLADIPHGAHQAVVAAMSDYQPSREVFEALYKRGTGFVRLGHGRKSAPQVISYGNGWMLAAGGSYQGKIKQVVPQPILLLTKDGPTTLDSVVHCPLPENDLKVDRTGVFGPFAVATHPFVLPPQAQLRRQEDYWQLYRIHRGMHVLNYNSEDVNALYVLPMAEDAARDKLESIALSNPELKTKGKVILHDGSQVFYDLNNGRKRWVITGYAPKRADRVDWMTTDFYNWPLEDRRELDVLSFE